MERTLKLAEVLQDLGGSLQHDMDRLLTKLNTGSALGILLEGWQKLVRVPLAFAMAETLSTLTICICASVRSKATVEGPVEGCAADSVMLRLASPPWAAAMREAVTLQPAGLQGGIRTIQLPSQSPDPLVFVRQAAASHACLLGTACRRVSEPSQKQACLEALRASVLCDREGLAGMCSAFLALDSNDSKYPLFVELGGVHALPLVMVEAAKLALKFPGAADWSALYSSVPVQRMMSAVAQACADYPHEGGSGSGSYGAGGSAGGSNTDASTVRPHVHNLPMEPRDVVLGACVAVRFWSKHSANAGVLPDACLLVPAVQAARHVLNSVAAGAEFRNDPLMSGEQLDHLCARRCGACSKKEEKVGPRLMACSKCGEAWYCGKECQAQHWPAHKQVCRRRTAASG